jgi:hypothetical protein
MSLFDLKSRMADIPGIEGLTMQLANGRQVFTIGEHVASTTAFASDAEIETAIRDALRLPSVALIPDKPKDAPMSTPAPGSFAASIRAMMDEARAGVAQARTDGLAKVGAAIAKLDEAKVQTARVAEGMARAIADEADAALAELGQISNMPPDEA